MALPQPALRTGDVERDVDALYQWVYQLLLALSADTGWSVTGTSTDKALTSGDTLTATQDVLATLIQTLTTKGILST